MLPQRIPRERITELERLQPSRSEPPGWLRERRKRQVAWLEAFETCLSPKAACQRSDVPLSTYEEWRRDPEFCKMFNHSLDRVVVEVQGAVVGRAIGYRPFDAEGNPANDADGKPIYQGGSDKLAMALLGMGEKKEVRDTVVIEIVSPQERVIDQD